MKTKELSQLLEISIPYASQLLSGKRQPSHSTALVMWRKSGLKFGALAGLSDRVVRQLDQAERDPPRAADGKFPYDHPTVEETARRNLRDALRRSVEEA